MVLKWKEQRKNTMRNISVGIDVGTTTTRVVVGEFIKGEKTPKIIGVGEAPTGHGQHIEAFCCDDLTANLAGSVGTVVDSRRTTPKPSGSNASKRSTKM